MRIYIFGNQDLKIDNLTFEVASKLKLTLPKLEIIAIKPNEDLPFDGNEEVIIMDTVIGIEKTMVFDHKHIDKIKNSPRFSVHDFDLGFQLKYLKKLGKIKEFKIIGLPMGKDLQINEIIHVINSL